MYPGRKASFSEDAEALVRAVWMAFLGGSIRCIKNHTKLSRSRAKEVCEMLGGDDVSMHSGQAPANTKTLRNSRWNREAGLFFALYQVHSGKPIPDPELNADAVMRAYESMAFSSKSNGQRGTTIQLERCLVILPEILNGNVDVKSCNKCFSYFLVPHEESFSDSCRACGSVDSQSVVANSQVRELSDSETPAQVAPKKPIIRRIKARN